MTKQTFTPNTSSWGNYGKIIAFGNKLANQIFDASNIVIEEKIDGSQFSFGIFDGVLKAKSKNVEKSLYPDMPEDDMFGAACHTIMSLKDKLRDGWTYRGEVVSKPKHNVLAYDRVPVGNIIIFDIETDNQEFLSYSEKEEEAKRLGLEVVPVFYEGSPEPLKDDSFIEELLNKTSILAQESGKKVEGFVIKSYNQFIDIGGMPRVLKVKVVSDQFREVHKKENTNLSGKSSFAVLLESLVEKYATEARWEKSVQYLKETDNFTGTPKDIGPLMKRVNQDILEECSDDIKELVFKFVWKQISKRLTHGLPEWYKSSDHISGW